MAETNTALCSTDDSVNFAASLPSPDGSPLFLHHSDHPGLLLVSKRLNGDNYNSWHRAMKISLSAKNKTGFITGEIKEPHATSKPKEHALWQRCNDMVLSWILNSLEPELADSVLSCDTPPAIWEDLHERFSLGNAPRIFQVQRDIYRIEQGQLSVAAYYTKLKGLWDELATFNSATCTCGAQNGSTKLIQFLMGLNESYSGARGQILLMNPLPSVRQAYASIVQEEKQRELGYAITAPSNTAAMVVRGNQNFPKSRQNNQNYGNPSNNSRTREPFQCTYCGDMYHRKSNCYKLIGYPPGHPRAKEKAQQHNQNFAPSRPSANQVDFNSTLQQLQVSLPNLTKEQYIQILSTLNPNPNPQANAVTPATPAVEDNSGLLPVAQNHWILDSGATHHITSSPAELQSVDTNSSLTPVSLPSGDVAEITFTGSIQFDKSFQLNNVLCVPSFKVNLMSVGKTTEDLHCSITFFPSWCILQDLATRMMIGVGKRRNDLYYLVALASTPSSSSFSCNLIISSNLWHRRLGHPSSSRLQFLSNNLIKFNFDSNHKCDVCPLAKQTRLPFPSSSISTTKCFELIHCDIWGRHKHPSLSGAFYFLTIVDDFSRFTWVFLMHHKSETQPTLRRFFHYVKTQFNTNIQQLRSDNGAEFLSLKIFFLDEGIIFQHSCVYTPQQNGVVERKHRHILETARALRFQSHLPITFWGECILTAVHLINRLPTLLLHKKTPFEVLYNKVPDYSRMRVFGCISFATIVNPSSKFSPRATKCIFIGYPMGQKAYKLYDITTKKIFTNRDVVFLEDTFHHSP